MCIRDRNHQSLFYSAWSNFLIVTEILNTSKSQIEMSLEASLKGKRIIITGAGRGIYFLSIKFEIHFVS